MVLALLGEGTEVGEWVVRAQGGAIFPTTLEGHGSAWLLFAAAYARAMLCLQPDSVPSVREHSGLVERPEEGHSEPEEGIREQSVREHYCTGNCGSSPREDSFPTAQLSGHRLEPVKGANFRDITMDHLARRLYGFVLSRLRLAQDVLTAIDKSMEHTAAEVRQWTYEINTAMMPWLRLWARVAPGPLPRRIWSIWSQVPDSIDTSVGSHIAYVRFTLDAGDMYVGRTSAFAARFNDHYRKVLRHSGPAPSCSACREHTKYTRMANLTRACKWIMIPLLSTETKPELSKVERWLIRTWKPNMNDLDQPFWQSRYRQEQRVHHRPRPRPRRPRPPRRLRPGTSQAPRSFHCYIDEADGRVWRDPTQLFRQLARDLQSTTLLVQPGDVDLVDWRKVRRLFGDSYLRCGDQAGPLKQFKQPSLTEPGRIYIRPQLTPEEGTGQLYWYLADGEPIKIPENAQQLEKLLCDLSSIQLADLWKQRKAIPVANRLSLIGAIWDEHKLRFPGLKPTPFKLSLPPNLAPAAWKVRAEVRQLLEKRTHWPEYIVEWHIRNMRITFTKSKKIADIMPNVRCPWRPTGCACQVVFERLRAKGSAWRPPTLEGHIFFIGREYAGPRQAVLQVGSVNVPRHTPWDARVALERELKCVPGTTDRNRREAAQRACAIMQPVLKESRWWPTTRDAYEVRKILDGLVIGEIDKNPGELSVCCPCLYEQALAGMYNEKTGYKEVVPRKLTSWQLKKHGVERAHAYVMQQGDPPKANQRGTVYDAMRSWKCWYKAKNLYQFGRFDTKGGLNTPYVLFKAKNITDPTVRESKWKKARPIAPGTRHPMRAILGKAGRAWYFAANQLRTGQFQLPLSRDIPTFLDATYRDLRTLGEVCVDTFDIEGCFPNMPKTAIEVAMLEIAETERRQGHEGVWVPRAHSKQCQWRPPARGGHNGTWLPWDVLLTILRFTLHNAYVRMPDGRILWQEQGIPMGDPLSPGMTIGTCAWMEREWTASIAPGDTAYFRAARYMDDIIIGTVRAEGWDRERFLRDFTASECYWKPLTLEQGTEGTFLETRFRTLPNGITYRLKNDNETRKTVWRYHHYYSGLPYRMKRATLMATLRKVHLMASDSEQLMVSAVAKLQEFLDLKYPVGILRFMCAIMARDYSDITWRRIRNTFLSPELCDIA